MKNKGWEVDYCCHFAYILLFIPMFYYSKDNFK